MTPEHERTIQEMYRRARWIQIRVAVYDCPRGDLGESNEQWQELVAFREAHAIGNEGYWRAVIPVEEKLFAKAKDAEERLYQRPGGRRPRFAPEQIASLMGYPRLPFYPKSISMLVALAFLSEWEQRGHGQV